MGGQGEAEQPPVAAVAVPPGVGPALPQVAAEAQDVAVRLPAAVVAEEQDEPQEVAVAAVLQASVPRPEAVVAGVQQDAVRRPVAEVAAGEQGEERPLAVVVAAQQDAAARRLAAEPLAARLARDAWVRWSPPVTGSERVRSLVQHSDRRGGRQPRPRPAGAPLE